MNKDEEEDEEDEDYDDEEEADAAEAKAPELSRPFQRKAPAASQGVLTSKSPQQSRAVQPPASRPPQKKDPVDKFAETLENADIGKELSDPKELEIVPHDEVDVLGMVYEILVYTDHASTDYVRGCRRINNFVLRGPRAPRFNNVFGKAKNVIRGTGVIVKALHSFDPFRRGINMPLTKIAAKRMGVVSNKAVDDFYKVYAQWKTEFLAPAMSEVPQDLHTAAFRDKKFFQDFVGGSTRWMMGTFQVGEDQADSLVNVTVKYCQLYLEELQGKGKPLYEFLEPQVVMRPAATPEDLERERIAKDINLQGTYDTRDDLFQRPSKKKRR